MEKEVEEFFMSIIENTVKYREENKVSRNDFIDLLLSLKNETVSKYQDHQEQEDINHFLSQVGSNQSKSKIGKWSSNYDITSTKIHTQLSTYFFFKK